MTSELVGASVWEREMYDYVSGHVESELAILDGYRDLAQEAQSPAFKYLAKLILEDEERHHRLFQDLAEAIRQMGELQTEDLAIPAIGDLAADRDLVLDATERFIATEEEDARELKELAKRLDDVGRTTLWRLLVEVMQDDTAKHIRILRFIRDQVKNPPY